MSITDLLPASELPDVRQRAEELFSREMLGAVLVGKFVGDYAAILATGLLGVHVGYPLGIVVTADTARKPTGFSRGRKRVSSAKQPTDYSIADSSTLYKDINKE